jgi:predicted RND superfamily exporter protein
MKPDMDTSTQDGTVRWSARWLNLVTRRPLLHLALLSLLTVMMVTWGAGISIRGDMEDLFPDDTPIVERAKEARNTVGSRSELLILIGSDDPKKNRAVGEELTALLSQESELIESVQCKRDAEYVAFFETNALLYLNTDELREIKGEVDHAIAQAVMVDDFEFEEDFGVDSDFGGDAGKDSQESRIPSQDDIEKKYGVQRVREYFESPDGQVLAVKAYPTFKPTDTARAQELNRRVKELVAKVSKKEGRERIKVTVEGEYGRLAETVDTIKSELRLATAIAVGGICLILLIGFRRIRSVFVVLVPMAVGLGWTLFMARLFVGYLNIITAFIFAILVGLGIDFVVHGAERVDEEYAEGGDLVQALQRGLGKLGMAMGAAALTTMATFAVLVVFDFRGFSQFGGLAAAGVFLCLVALYVYLPPLALSMHRVRAHVRHQPVSTGDEVGPLKGRRAQTVAGLLVYMFIGLATWGVVSLPSVEFEADTSRWRVKRAAKSSELSKKYREEGEKRSYAPALVVTDGLEETQAVHRHLEADVDTGGLLQSVRSVYTLVPEEQEIKLQLIGEMKRKIDNKYDYLDGQAKLDADKLMPHLEPHGFKAVDLPKSLKRQFTDTKGQFGRYVLLYFNGRKSNARHVEKIRDAYEVIKVDGKTFYSTATYYILAEAFKVVQEDGPLAVGLAAGVILLLLIIFFGLGRDVLVIYVPLVVSFLILMGLLAWASVPLNIFNIVVLPIAFGIGVDTSIHLVMRFNAGTSLWRTLQTTGKAAFISTATTTVGFLSLLCVSNEGLQSLGIVAALGVGCAYVCSVGLFSAAVLLGWKKAA